jgi:glycosyltransferase involved in cell wall biosynthesis
MLGRDAPGKKVSSFRPALSPWLAKVEMIGFNLVSLGSDVGGIGQYAHSLIKNLSRLYEEKEFIVFLGRDCRLKWDRKNVREVRLDFDSSSAIKRRLAESRMLGRVLADMKFDGLMHSVNNVSPPIKGVRHVVTVHDILWRIDRRRFGFLKRLYLSINVSRSIRTADAVIAVSQSTKNDIVKYLGYDSSKIRMIHEAVPEEFMEETARYRESETGKSVKGRYFLYVGRIERGKNVLSLIKAFRSALGNGIGDYRLIVAGEPSWKSRYEKEVGAVASGEPRIEFAGHIPPSRLPGLYANAYAFVLPSLYEGFGLPVLEAMYSGVPVITSNRSSLAEIAGSAALLVDPGSQGSIKRALLSITRDQALREELIRKGSRRVAEFSWERAAMESMEVYKNVLAK